MEPEVQFVGVRIPARQSVPVDERLEEGMYISTLHITQFALGENPKPGRNTISVKTVLNEKFVLGTLEKGRCEQFQADFMLPGELEVINSGDTEVHLTGYKTITSLNDIVPDDLAASESPSLSEDDGDFEDELARQELQKSWRRQALKQKGGAGNVGVPILSTAQQRALGEATAAELGANISKEDDEEDDDDEEEEGDFDDSDDPDELLGDDSSDDGDEGEDDSDDEDGALVEAETAMQDAGQHVKVRLEDKLTAVNGKKRTAEVPAIQPTKKLKAEGPAKVQPVQGASASGSGDGEWESAIFQHISTAGPIKLGALGSVVKKPAGVTRKLKQIIIDSKRLAFGKGDEVNLA